MIFKMLSFKEKLTNENLRKFFNLGFLHEFKIHRVYSVKFRKEFLINIHDEHYSC